MQSVLYRYAAVAIPLIFLSFSEYGCPVAISGSIQSVTTFGTGFAVVTTTPAPSLALNGLPANKNAAVSLTPIKISFLPVEAQTTLKLIKRGGPFPYPRDGIVFKNYEGQLPTRASGYYHEYTVPTPGLTNRGAQRIIIGRRGELYYTNNHYRTFMEISR